MANDNLIGNLQQMREKYRRKAREAKTENLRHPFEGMAEAYENALEIAEVAGEDRNISNLSAFNKQIRTH
jgi:hypothetical protein